ncbi:MAG TPA: HNH endonuclease, partial [Mycobacteriales bacterium]|nr:HNH endonuclease [Mycobacteriales bacterium]
CAIPSQRCDADHTIAHARGGGTDPDNLRPRCRRHHRCKTHTDWQVLHNPDGTTTWITPGGYHRTFPPTRLAGDEPGG